MARTRSNHQRAGEEVILLLSENMRVLNLSTIGVLPKLYTAQRNSSVVLFWFESHAAFARQVMQLHTQVVSRIICCFHKAPELVLPSKPDLVHPFPQPIEVVHIGHKGGIRACRTFCACHVFNDLLSTIYTPCRIVLPYTLGEIEIGNALPKSVSHSPNHQPTSRVQ